MACPVNPVVLKTGRQGCRRGSKSCEQYPASQVQQEPIRTADETDGNGSVSPPTPLTHTLPLNNTNYLHSCSTQCCSVSISLSRECQAGAADETMVTVACSTPCTAHCTALPTLALIPFWSFLFGLSCTESCTEESASPFPLPSLLLLHSWATHLVITFLLFFSLLLSCLFLSSLLFSSLLLSSLVFSLLLLHSFIALELALLCC